MALPANIMLGLKGLLLINTQAYYKNCNLLTKKFAKLQHWALLEAVAQWLNTQLDISKVKVSSPTTTTGTGSDKITGKVTNLDIRRILDVFRICFEEL